MLKKSIGVHIKTISFFAFLIYLLLLPALVVSSYWSVPRAFNNLNISFETMITASSIPDTVAATATTLAFILLSMGIVLWFLISVAVLGFELLAIMLIPFEMVNKKKR